MAYGLIYKVEFKNRILNDIYAAEIYKKDYAGVVRDLKGADAPLTLALDDADILNPIRATQLTLSFLNDGLKIEDFYSNNDQEFRIDFFFISDKNGAGVKTLLFSGYMVQDESSEPDTDRKHIINIKATDNLALLKSFTWLDTKQLEPSNKYALAYYFHAALTKTGLFSGSQTIPRSLPVRRYANIFENTMQDRGDNRLSEGVFLCNLHSNMFQTDTETWDDLYSILTAILFNLNAGLVQAGGTWNFYREPEFSYFPGGIIPGVQSHYNGSIVQYTPVETNPVVTISRSGGDIYPIQEDLTKYIQRPLKEVINTFQYQQPNNHIIQGDLVIPVDAVPYDTETTGDFRYDRYSIATYFPRWTHRHGDASYLEIVTDISTDPENEKDRYIVIPGVDAAESAIQFNPVAISKGDIVDFSASMKTLSNSVDPTSFWVRVVLITPDGNFYVLNRRILEIDGTDRVGVNWFGPFPANHWDTTQYVPPPSGTHPGYLVWPYEAIAGEWQQIAAKLTELGNTPLAPADGMLLVQMNGTNFGPTDRNDACFKDARLSFTNFINESTLITGHEHKTTGNPDIKSEQKNDIEIDDAPRSTIAGTLFTDALTQFGYTDINTGANTDIPGEYFTRTANWHRGGNNEALRLGDIITRERLQMLYTSRYVREGTFRNVRYDTDKFINALSLYKFDWLPDRFFFATKLTIDYMNNSFNARLQEIFKIPETDIIAQYFFRYIYKTE